LALIGNREGKFVDYVGLERDQEAVAVHYRNSGYLDVKITARLLFDEGKDTTVAQFDIEEGPRYRRGKVVVQGNLLTDPVVVLREVGIPEGAPAGEKDLLKFQQSVYGTGLYKSVRIQKVKRTSEGILDLVVEVEETLFFEIEFGPGYGTDTGVRGFVGAKNRNLDGRGRSFSTRLSASQKEQKYIGDLREPWILGNRWKWEGGLTAYYQEAVRKSFSLRKASVIPSITQTFFERSSLSFQYELSRDHVFDVAPGAILSREDQGSANIAAARVLFVLDLRDDPFNPRRGSVNSGSAELASYYFGSEVDYYKLAGQSSWYFPLFRKSTFVASGRGGYIRPLRDTVEVPIQKRFFLGGRTTVRGFEEESLGPRAADGTPTGGNYMLNLNAELRLPLQYGFNLALFVDAGSVWLRGTQDAGFDLRESTGLGLRYVTPVGPIALDYGWKLDRREGESASEWHFTIGAVF
jgi:outer membrane protein insertion porin family